MFRFFETIKIIDGLMQNIDYHQNRMDDTLIFYGEQNNFFISETQIPEEYKRGLVKFRLDYDSQNYKTEFSFYKKRNIRSLKIISYDDIEYPFKFNDRKMFLHLLSKKQDCDDILIVKDGKITEASFCNVILFDGDKWFTPDSPLLNGTCRQRMLKAGKIEEKTILRSDLSSFQSLVLINSMIGENFEDPILINYIK